MGLLTFKTSAARDIDKGTTSNAKDVDHLMKRRSIPCLFQ